MSDSVLAFDLGGTHVASAVVNGAGWQDAVACSNLIQAASRDELLEEIQKAGLRAVVRSGQSLSAINGIAMAAPNPFDYANGTSFMQHKLEPLFGVNMKEQFSWMFKMARENVLFLNDADAFLLGEIENSEIREPKVIGITLGTGVGSAFSVSGKIVTDGEGVPPNGEIYNLPWNDGTIEDVISTRSICDAYKGIFGQCRTVKEISALAADSRVRSVFEAFGRNLGLVLSGLCQAFQPDLVIIGGGIARSAPLFLEQTRASIGGFCPALRVSGLFENAALSGAARHWRYEQRMRREETREGQRDRSVPGELLR